MIAKPQMDEYSEIFRTRIRSQRFEAREFTAQLLADHAPLQERIDLLTQLQYGQSFLEIPVSLDVRFDEERFEYRKRLERFKQDIDRARLRSLTRDLDENRRAFEEELIEYLQIKHTEHEQVLAKRWEAALADIAHTKQLASLRVQSLHQHTEENRHMLRQQLALTEKQIDAQLKSRSGSHLTALALWEETILEKHLASIEAYSAKLMGAYHPDKIDLPVRLAIHLESLRTDYGRLATMLDTYDQYVAQLAAERAQLPASTSPSATATPPVRRGYERYAPLGARLGAYRRQLDALGGGPVTGPYVIAQQTLAAQLLADAHTAWHESNVSDNPFLDQAEVMSDHLHRVARLLDHAEIPLRVLVDLVGPLVKTPSASAHPHKIKHQQSE